MPIRHRRNLIRDCQDFKIQYLVTVILHREALILQLVISLTLISHIIEYFIHRAGRTGRMGQSGDVYSLVGQAQNSKPRKKRY